MNEENNELERAEQAMREEMEAQRTTSFAKEIKMDSQENAMDRTESIKEPFENARDNVQPEPEQARNNEPDQAQTRHDPAPGMDLRYDGPGSEAVDREAFDAKQQTLDQEARALREALEQRDGIDHGNGVELDHGRNTDSSDRGR